MLNNLGAWFWGMGVYDVIGVIGVIFYVGAYLALQLGLLRGDGYSYPILNLIASGSVLISLLRDFNPFSATIETCWIVISLIGITRLFIVHRIALSDEQAEVARRIVPSLKKDRARRLLKLGRFVDAPEGFVLTEMGKPVQDLAMVMEGYCSIDRGGLHIGTISVGALVGELTFATGAPATATVRTTAPARLFLIDRKALLAFMARNPDAMADMERSVAGDLRLKLTQTTTRLSTVMGEREVS
ncbi:CBU_0592 family membrane protein [Seohaeicola zhoushanensis]|uniref:Cyclic nucleotide-binding domain-containing protein n=1 Tax=Seohaeicola zhoushanensis TaxID=1569283 RepID=A0A8J3M661_9RHOB|nr:cyclic nucleotide-binding domain-containing protein [Seohaeicola zhoushanensis]GHF40195.1 hypothetical protein GCM10017056_09680 [Seohaeicola zhoushanensis]